MKRVSLFLTLVVLASMLLAACGAQATPTSVPDTNVPPPATSTSEMTATEAPTSTTEANTTSTPSSPSVPVTGGNVPSQRITSLIGSSVCGMAGDPLGTVKDMVLDFNQGSVTYLIVDANGKSVPVPYSFLAMPMMTGTGAGSGTGTTGTLATEIPSAGGAGTSTTATPAAGATESSTTSTPAAATDTPSAGGAVSTATSTTSTGSGASTQQGCMTLTVGNDVFNAVPDFDPSIMPGMGESSADWDTAIMPYWVGGVEDIATNTPEPAVTSTPEAVGTSTPSAGGASSETATAIPVEGGMPMQGVALASQLLNADIVQDSGTGASPGTGFTVQDIVIEPRIGKLQYVVVSSGSADTWIPVPISVLGWNASNNQLVLMIDAGLLQNAPTVPSAQFPDTSMSGWDQEFLTYWQGGGTGSSGGISVSTATATP
jgi:sporulation protein YlmC with PRC-barrel domain